MQFPGSVCPPEGRGRGENQVSEQRSPVPRRVIQLDDPRHDAQRSVSRCISLNICISLVKIIQRESAYGVRTGTERMRHGWRSVQSGTLAPERMSNTTILY